MRLSSLDKVLFFMLLALLMVSNLVFALPAIDADYEKEILVERGWVKYITIPVKNVGDETLNNVTVSFENGHTDWFKTVTNKTSIPKNSSLDFIVKLNVPFEVEVGNYDFAMLLESNERTESKPLSLLLFSSKTEMLIYQMNGLKTRLNALQQSVDIAESRGKEVDDIRVSLEGASSIISTAEKYIVNQLFNDAVDKIKNVEYLLKEAEYELSIAEDREIQASAQETDWSLVFIVLIVIVVIFISLKNKKLRGRNIGRVLKGPEFKLKNIIKRGLGKNALDKQIEELKRSQQLLDEEYKKKIISKDSYKELSSLNQQRLLELEQKRK